MKKLFQYTFCLFVAFIFSGCAITQTHPVGTIALPSPSYIHYFPPEDLGINLEFDYPSSWVIEEIRTYMDLNIRIISLFDPRSDAVQTPQLYSSHPLTPNNFGYVSIVVSPLETRDNVMETLKQNCNDLNSAKLLGDYKIQIDGHDASVLECHIDLAESPPIFERRIFFTIDDQLYEITYYTEENERGGEFEQGYDYFFNSIKIVP